tara:strand:+ start:607 stop:1194 length:588 start_codon:yes stop_codon:yes gene_type:complete
MQKKYKIIMKKIFIIDNYDSFTYNLVHYFHELNCKTIVKRNDEFNINEVKNYNHIVLSPGPGIPEEAGLMKSTIEKYKSTHKILGVCLGHQAIGEVFGATLVNLDNVYHGVDSQIKVLIKDVLFKELPKNFVVGRYHSWIIKKSLPDCLEITSVDNKNQIMSIRHKKYNVRGVQFHPESILTPFGKKILSNWINC